MVRIISRRRIKLWFRISCTAMVACCVTMKMATADLPIHATTNDVKGAWTFYLSPSITSTVHSCGSNAPNRNTDNLQPDIANYKSFLQSLGGLDSKVSLILSEDTVPFSGVNNIDGNNHRKIWRTLSVLEEGGNSVVGGWTTVYDEGFEVKLADQMRLMALMKYEKDDNCPEAKDGDLEDPNGRTTCYRTDPSHTQIGWYSKIGEDGFTKSGCFYAEKGEFHSEPHTPSSFVYVRQRKSGKDGTEVPHKDLDLSYYASKEFADKHNEKLSRSWNATYSTFLEEHRTVLSSLVKDFGFSKVKYPYGYEAVPSFVQGAAFEVQKASSQAYACPCKAGELVIDSRSVQQSDNPVLSPVSMLQGSTISANVMEHQHYLTLNEDAPLKNQRNVLPREFAWSNPFSTEPFADATVNQGGCGSCYAVAAVYALQKRFEIAASKLAAGEVKLFKDLPDKMPSFMQNHQLSPQSVLSCSFYNQGCHGGFPYLVGKHAREIGVIEETCMPYLARDNLPCPGQSNTGGNAEQTEGVFLTTAESSSAGSCHSLEKRWYAKDYGYVGGCYECRQCAGEENIMAEILANGPVVAAFDAPASLFLYKDGIYDTEDSPHARFCDSPPPPGAETSLTGWEFTNHAVNIVGWGETEGTEAVPAQKYWIVRNTWGPTWGHKGHFLLVRGRNVGGIESQVSYIDPDFSRGAGKALLQSISGRGAQRLEQ